MQNSINDYKEIHIGLLIKKRVEELDMSMNRICNFLNCGQKEVKRMFESESIDSHLILRWSKLLEYDFFRIYTQHLVLFSPDCRSSGQNMISLQLPQFKKNIYTKEIRDFMIELVETGQKTKQQIVLEYKIPKTTLYKWFLKYNKRENGIG
ncbi:transposase [Chryseobacterium sp.]|uniref:transposase n=1 Tax=Chryseobacterium sp. TaxID=1871047 RepID=UPI0031D3F7B6